MADSEEQEQNQEEEQEQKPVEEEPSADAAEEESGAEEEGAPEPDAAPEGSEEVPESPEYSDESEEESTDSEEDETELEDITEELEGGVLDPDRKKYGYVWGTGRRKTSVARVRLSLGDGNITVNGKDYKTYFQNLKDQVSVEEPLKDTGQRHEYDIQINASGGGKAGQAEAALLGIARALLKANPKLESILRENDHLTRDPRMKERRKYGQHGARRGKQYSKR